MSIPSEPRSPKTRYAHATDATVAVPAPNGTAPALEAELGQNRSLVRFYRDSSPARGGFATSAHPQYPRHPARSVRFLARAEYSFRKGNCMQQTRRFGLIVFLAFRTATFAQTIH